MSDVVVSTRDEGSPCEKREGWAIDARAFYVIPVQQVGVASAGTARARRCHFIHSHGGSSAEGSKVGIRHPYSSGGASCGDSDLPPLPLHWQIVELCPFKLQFRAS